PVPILSPAARRAAPKALSPPPLYSRPQCMHHDLPPLSKHRVSVSVATMTGYVIPARLHLSTSPVPFAPTLAPAPVYLLAVRPKQPGRLEEARANYEAAARYPTAYCGQLARASSGWTAWTA